MTAALPNYHALGVLILIGLALFLFSRDRIPLETTSLIILVILAVGFEVFPYTGPDGRMLQPTDFFLGFGHQALVAVCGLMILGYGLVRSGALEPIGRFLGLAWRKSPALSMLLTLLVCAVLSAFINNTPIVVMLLPILIGVAIRTGSSPSGMLLPVGLVSIVGGMATTVGTSTNLLVVGVAADLGVAPFSMFDFAVPVIIAGSLAILYLWLIAPRLIPDRKVPMQQAGVSRLYTAQIRLERGGVAVGKTLSEAIDLCDGTLKVEKIQRGPGVFVTPLPDVVLKAGDRLTTTNTQENLREFARCLDGKLYSGDYEVDEEHPLTVEDQIIAEVAITPNSRLLGVRIGQARLLARYGLRLLALHRFDGGRQPRTTDVDNTVLRAGDVLLVQASAGRLDGLKNSGDFLILDGSVNLPKTRKAPLALSIMAAVILVAALGILPIAISAILGVMFMILTRCLTWKESMSALSIRVVMIIVVSLALGIALTRTGGADWIAQLYVAVSFGIAAPLILGGLMLLMAALTNVVSNNAAAVIGTPIAVSIAQQLALPAEPFVLAVLFGANLSFATPMAYQTNVLVMNAGGYRFQDFVRVGLPLLVIMWVVLTAVLAYAYQI